ncbi:arylamine N-acetyltransferase family protein [Jatrophihabitans fulvus]
MNGYSDELDTGVRDAYLGRLGVEAAPPSVGLLREIARRHVERVPYETFWIAAGEQWTVDPSAAAARIAHEGRGGYCYHLNGALALLLTSLGFDVRGHVGSVHGETPSPDDHANHLALTVSGLPSDDNPDGRWYVDAGLGDALHDPLPLVPGDHPQGPFRFVLGRTDGDGWCFTHDPSGSFRTMTWTLAPASPSDFASRHAWLSGSAESGFVRTPVAQRRDAGGVDIARALMWSRVGHDAVTARAVTGKQDWFARLDEVFGLRFEAMPDASRTRLWHTLTEAHRRFESTRT